MTNFQEKVYSIVSKIPRGKTQSYSQIARILKTSPRAVGQALKKNYDKNIPCHRVIMSSGKLGGYHGKHYKEKERLLRKEGIILRH